MYTFSPNLFLPGSFSFLLESVQFQISFIMLEQIIDQASSTDDKTSTENNDLPDSLPSSRAKFLTRQTSFGRVRVDLPAKSEGRRKIEELYKNYDPRSEPNRILDERIWSLTEEDIDDRTNEIDFYGLNNAHHRNFKFEERLSSSSKKEKVEDNYIDQLAFPELMSKEPATHSPPIREQTIHELKTESMNVIDEQYFGTLKQLGEHREPTDQPLPVKRIELPPAEELNYFDQLLFNVPTTDKTSAKPVPPTVKKIQAATRTETKRKRSKIIIQESNSLSF